MVVAFRELVNWSVISTPAALGVHYSTISANLGDFQGFPQGFEGLALNSSGTKLYAMLEGALQPDDQRDRLLINEFDLATQAYTGQTFFYQRDPQGQAIGDLTAINDHEFLVIERDHRQGDPNNSALTRPAEFKRIYKIDINQLDSEGFVEKELFLKF